MKDAHPIDYYCAADAMGGGVCPINFCGTLQTANALAANPPGYPQSGADSLCNSGRVCVVGPPVATGNAFQLDCVAPAAGALAFGSPCSTASGQCANDSLCVASADFPSQFFCSTMCRNDADCPASSSCLEYPTAKAPDGSAAKVGMCTPASKIAATACKSEVECPSGQGCVSYGSRTELTVCKTTGGTKMVGQPCAANSECLSGQCFDRNFRIAGGNNRAYCSSVCGFNSDCGPDQMCVRLVQNNNGTPSDPSDDVVTGICQTLFVPTASTGCGIDSDCTAMNNGSDTCDATHGLCYNSAALPGSACTADTGCMVGGVCSMGTRFPGGYCQIFGCSTGAAGTIPGVNLCPGTGSVCLQRGAPDYPLNACYDGCKLGSDAGGQDCLRPTQYTCSAPASGQPASICLGQVGT
jgi:hypothetical protein